jgi:hypothetical protein
MIRTQHAIANQYKPKSIILVGFNTIQDANAEYQTLWHNGHWAASAQVELMPKR